MLPKNGRNQKIIILSRLDGQHINHQIFRNFLDMNLFGNEKST